MSPAKRTGILFAFIAWAVLILVGYYYYHKPLDPSQLGPLFAALRDLIVSSGIFLASAGLGRYVMRNHRLDGLDGLATQAGLGAGILSISWLGLSTAGLIYGWLACILLISLLVLLRGQILACLKQLSSLTGLWENSGWLERSFLAAAAFFALNQVWFALAPPLKYDALTYHLALPRVFVEQARLVYTPANPYWGHPLLGEMLYTWAFALGRAQSAAMTGWMFGVLAVLGIGGLAHRWLPAASMDLRMRASAASAAMLAILVGSTARWMLGWGYTDLFSALLGTACLASFFQWLENGQIGWWYWACVFAGLAVGTKYTSGILCLALFPAALFIWGQRRLSVKEGLLGGLISLAVFCPWIVKDLIVTGSPVFPYFFPIQGYSADRLAMANTAPAAVDWLTRVFLPVTFTWQGIDSAAGPGTDLGPLLILFAVPAVIGFFRSKHMRFSLAGLLLAWLFMAIGGARVGHLQQPRLYFALLPCLGLASGWGWAKVQQLTIHGVRLRRIAGALVMLVLALVFWQELPRPTVSGAFQTVLGAQTQATYLLENSGAYAEAMQTLQNLPASSHVLMLWEARSLYAPSNAAPDPWLDRWRVDWKEKKNTGAVLAGWRSQGYTQILLYRSGMEMMRASDANLSPPDWDAFDTLLASLPPPQTLTGGFYQIYDLR